MRKLKYRGVGITNFSFDDDIAHMDTFTCLKDRKMTRAEEKFAYLETVSTRDTNTKSLKYFKKGHFHVNWKKKGDLIRTKTVTFFRRNENMVSISYNKNTGRVLVAGRSLSEKQTKQMHDLESGMIGEMHVINYTIVIAYNATKVKKLSKRGPRFRMYTWEVKNIFDKTPSIRMAMR